MIERRSLGSMRWAALWFVALFSGGACEGSGGTDSNTNWLDACTKDADCGTLGCLCGQCSKPCSTAADCSEFLGATCRDNTTRGGSCATIAGGSCARTCSTNADCGRSDLACRGGYCASRLDASLGDAGAGGAGGASASAGGQDAGGRGPMGDGSPGAAGVLDGRADAAGRDSSGDGSRPEDARIVDRTSDGSTDASRDGGIVSDTGGDTSSVQIPVDGTGILNFVFPARHSRTDADGIRVAGTVQAGSGVVRVFVNSVPADSLEGSFARWRTSADVPLQPGRNDLRIVAERDHGPPLTMTGFLWRVAGDDLVPGSPPLAFFSAVSIGWDPFGKRWIVPDRFGPWTIDEGGGFPSQTAVQLDLSNGGSGDFYTSAIVVDPTGTVYASDVETYNFPNSPVAYQGTLYRIDLATGQGVSMWSGGVPGTTPLGIALDVANSRIITVGSALVSVDLATNTPTVLSDATHGSGPPLSGSYVVLEDTNHALLPGCSGAMEIDLATGDRTTWGSIDARPCIVASGMYNGKVIVLSLESSSDGSAPMPQRWQAYLLDPSARTISPLFEFESLEPVTAATLDPDAGRLAVVASDGAFSNPHVTIETYDLPGGNGPASVLLSPFGDGPVVGPFRTELVLGATLGDGRLAAFNYANGAAVVDPDTGRRVPLPPNDAGTPSTIGVASDPATGGLFVIENDGLTLLSSDLSSSRLIGSVPPGPPGPFAYDPPSHTVYIYSDNIYAVDTATGTNQVVGPNPGGFCAFGLYISVLPDRNTLFTYGDSNVPGPCTPFIGRTFTVDIATGVATPSSYAFMTAARDGRLLSFDGSGISVVDPGTGVSTPLGGRGYSLTGGQGSVLVVDPRRDRLWVTPGANGGAYFAVDPFNGDRVLVSN